MTFCEFKKYLSKMRKLNIMLHVCPPEEKKHIEYTLMELEKKIDSYKKKYITKDNIKELNDM